MPGPCIKRHILHNFPGPADQAMCGNPQRLYFSKKRMCIRVQRALKKLVNIRTTELSRRQTDIVDHQ